jgi:hypothetical protein
MNEMQCVCVCERERWGYLYILTVPVQLFADHNVLLFLLDGF